MNKKCIPYDEIARYIRQESHGDEKELVEEWINVSDKNRKLFEELLHEWENIYDSPDLYAQANRSTTWTSIASHIQSSLPTQLYTKQLLLRIASIAAMIALVAGAGVSFFIKSTLDSSFMAQAVTTVETLQGQKMQMVLPDGTKVWLNSDSKLIYSADFNRSERIVNLQGEAFFDVTKDEGKKFVVKTSHLDVVVKGTSFDVTAYPEDKDIRVSLLEGSVLITDKNNKALTDLSPNQLAIVSRDNMRYSLYKDDAETYRSWMQNELIFYNADIYEVAKKLERWYGINITLVKPDEKQKYTFSVKTESLRELLELFKKITPIEYTISGKEVTITHK